MFLKLQNLKKWLEQNNFKKESLNIDFFLKNSANKNEILFKYKDHPKIKQIESLVVELSSFPQKYILWGIKQLERNEPINEIIDTIKDFDLKYKNKLKSKGKSPDLLAYKTLGELRGAIEEIGTKTRKDESIVAAAGAKKIYEDKDYLVVHPETTEASMLYGRGTKWCVSATETKNYFESYAGSNIFLYFIISKHADKDDDMHKIAYAYAKREDGVVSAEIFDALDESITEEDVHNSIGEKFNPIKTAIFEHLKSQKVTKFKEILVNTSPQELLQVLELRPKSNIVRTLYREFKELRNPETKSLVASKLTPEIYFADNLFKEYPQHLKEKLAEVDDKTYFAESRNNQRVVPIYTIDLKETKERIENINPYGYFELNLDKRFPNERLTEDKAAEISPYAYFERNLDKRLPNEKLTEAKANEVDPMWFFSLDSLRHDLKLSERFPEAAKNAAKILSENGPRQFFRLRIGAKYPEFIQTALENVPPKDYFSYVPANYSVDTSNEEYKKIAIEKVKQMDDVDFFSANRAYMFFPEIGLEKAKNMNPFEFFELGVNNIYPDLKQDKKNRLTQENYDRARRIYVENQF